MGLEMNHASWDKLEHQTTEPVAKNTPIPSYANSLAWLWFLHQTDFHDNVMK